MKWIALVVLVATLAGLCSAQIDCFGEGLPKNPKTTAVAKGSDDFSLDLFRKIALAYPGNSIVVSPYSVWSVLNLAYFGAKGSTESQLKTALRVPSKSDSFYGGKVIESSLRLNKGTIFNKLDKAYFASNLAISDCAFQKLPEVEHVNFNNAEAAANKINADVASATKGKISKFLTPAVIANAHFVLINAVYFKGIWTYPFLKSRTTERPFFDEARKANISTVNMMSGEAKLRYVDSDVLGASVLELPYEDSNIVMFLLLPYAGQSSINSVLPLLTSDVLDQVTRAMKIKTVVVSLPRFKMTTRIADELKNALLNIGITDLFDASKADLSNFVTKGGVFVDDSLHHATIEVTEEGTVAAAATALIGTRSGASDTVVFSAERPFIFIIRDVSQGLTLFMGVLRNPSHTTPF